MLPDSCCEREIKTTASEIDAKAIEAEKLERKEKPRGNIAFPELSSVGLTGFEPATSTPPV
jgi:hypothetical protein